MWEKTMKAQAEKSNNTCLDCSDFWMGCCTGDCEPFTPIHTPVLDLEKSAKNMASRRVLRRPNNSRQNVRRNAKRRNG